VQVRSSSRRALGRSQRTMTRRPIHLFPRAQLAVRALCNFRPLLKPNQTKPNHTKPPGRAEDRAEPNPSRRTPRRSRTHVSRKLADRDARTRSIVRTLDAPRTSSRGAANRDDRESLFQTEIDRYRKLDRHE
jgi:hypothetical protein